MKRTQISLILGMIASISLFACGDAGENAVDTTAEQPQAKTETQTAEDVLKANLPDADFDGYTFKMLHDVTGWGTYTEESLVFEEEAGEILTDALHRRNRKVEEVYHCVISEIISTDVTGDLTRSIMAGDDSYDVGMVVYGWAKGTDMLMDFHEVPNIDLTMPWWDQNAVTQLSVGGKLTNALSDLMITHRDGTVGVFYNKKLASDYDLPDFYTMVRDGTWTLDAFYSAARAVAGDVNGDGTITGDDRFGLSGIPHNTIVSQLLGAGVAFTYNDADELPQIGVGDEASVTRIAKVLELYYTDNLVYDPTVMKASSTQAIFEIFKEDRALFMAHGVGSAYILRDMASDFGVLPAPKYEESQDFYANELDAGKYLVIPKTATDPSRTGHILEALSYEGYRTVVDAYYETMLKDKLMRDEDSIEMLDVYIFPNVVQKGFCSSPIEQMLLGIKDITKIASTIESRMKSNQKQIDNIVESMMNED